MALDIPDREAGSLAVIKKFSSSSMNELVAVLECAPPTSNPKELAEQVAKRVPSIPAESLSRFLDTLYNLYHIRELSGVSHTRFLEDLMDGLKTNPSLQLKGRQHAAIKAHLEKLMSVESLRTVAKAARLQRDGERLYCSGKILSDVRAVFGKDAMAAPLGAVLTHTLKIGYHEGREHREFHLVLDASDLDKLKDVIERAQAKDKTLREFLRKSQLPSLDE